MKQLLFSILLLSRAGLSFSQEAQDTSHGTIHVKLPKLIQAGASGLRIDPRILRFDITIILPGGEITCKAGPNGNTAFFSLYSRAPKGTKIYIERIFRRSADDRERPVPPMILVKE